MSGMASAASTIPGSMATFSSCSSERSPASAPSSSSSANTRAGTRMPGRASRGISHSISPMRIGCSSDVEDDMGTPPSLPGLEAETVQRHRLDEVPRLAAPAGDRRAQPVRLQLERLQPLRHELLHLGEEHGAVAAGEHDLVASRLAAVAAHEVGERAQRSFEDARLGRRLELQLDLADVLDEPVRHRAAAPPADPGRHRAPPQSSTKVTFRSTRKATTAPSSIFTCCWLTHAALIPCSVSPAFSMPRLIASSKLSGDSAVISITFATDVPLVDMTTLPRLVDLRIVARSRVPVMARRPWALSVQESFAKLLASCARPSLRVRSSPASGSSRCWAREPRAPSTSRRRWRATAASR